MATSKGEHLEDGLAPAKSGSDEASNSDLEKNGELTAAQHAYGTPEDQAVVTLKTWAVVVVRRCLHDLFFGGI